MTERVVFHETVRFANFSALLPAHLSAKASRMPRMTPKRTPMRVSTADVNVPNKT